MITHDRFPPDPWAVREVGFNLEVLAQSESLFAVSNGHIGVRGNLDEGDPSGLPGTYLNSFYERRPLPYAEAGYGYPESGESVVNVTNGKLIRLLVDDQPFDMTYGEVLSHERVLDLRAGVLRRHTQWRSPSGAEVVVISERLVSLSQRAVLAVRYTIEPVNDSARVVIQSELRANEPTPTAGDPRAGALITHPLVGDYHWSQGRRAALIHHTNGSGLRLAVMMDHNIECPGERGEEIATGEDWARYSLGTHARPGNPLVVHKLVAYGWSSNRSADALRAQVEAAILIARNSGWDGLVAEQKEMLDRFWAGADVEVDGSEEIQQAVRFGLFHAYQSSARAEQRPIPAKGLTGPGYDGHAFWDTEAFVLPMLTATAPEAVVDTMIWRHNTLAEARSRAAALHLEGATFPWRTITGPECSSYWPAGTAAFHINGAIALAAARYVHWTGDDEFERRHGLPLLVETARLWASLGYVGSDERFHIDGVTGPDEYTAVVDDNVYTNLTARRNLFAAAAAVSRWPEEAAALGADDEEADRWVALAEAAAVPYDETRGVHQQSRGFTDAEVWDFDKSARDDAYPLLLHAPYFDIYRKQVIKQADLVLAMHWYGDRFTREEKARNVAYYEPLTVRDSSLSACTQAVLAAEVGHLDLAADYLAEAALMDLGDLEHNTRDGLHIASLAGAWLALIAGFGGMRDTGDDLSFAPQLPPGWQRLVFTVRWRGQRLRVEIVPGTVTYLVQPDDGEDGMRISHGGTPVHLRPGVPAELPWQPVGPRTAPPRPPKGREPLSAREVR